MKKILDAHENACTSKNKHWERAPEARRARVGSSRTRPEQRRNGRRACSRRASRRRATPGPASTPAGTARRTRARALRPRRNWSLEKKKTTRTVVMKSRARAAFRQFPPSWAWLCWGGLRCRSCPWRACGGGCLLTAGESKGCFRRAGGSPWAEAAAAASRARTEAAPLAPSSSEAPRAKPPLKPFAVRRGRCALPWLLWARPASPPRFCRGARGLRWTRTPNERNDRRSVELLR